MNSLVPALSESLSLFRRDKWLIVLAMIPVTLGVLCYYYLGQWIYGDLLTMGEDYIRSKVDTQSWFSVITTLLVVILTVAFYFVVSWTFVLVISLLACPFNDMMSTRVEKMLMSGEVSSIGESLTSSFSKVLFTIVNELKKVLFIMMISIVGLVLSLFVPPLSFFISCMLVAVSFIDYSWGRHDLRLGKCLRSYRSSFVAYTVSGAIFLVLISIPVLNLFMIPLGVVFFSRLFAEFDLGYKRENLS